MKNITVKFVTARIPDAANVYAYPDPLPGEKDQFADFYVAYHACNRPLRIHVSCVREGSVILQAATPRELACDTRATALKTGRLLQTSRIRLHSSGLHGELLTTGKNDWVVFHLLVQDADTFLFLQWRQFQDRTPSQEVLTIGHSIALLRR